MAPANNHKPDHLIVTFITVWNRQSKFLVDTPLKVECLNTSKLDTTPQRPLLIYQMHRKFVTASSKRKCWIMHISWVTLWDREAGYYWGMYSTGSDFSSAECSPREYHGASVFVEHSSYLIMLCFDHLCLASVHWIYIRVTQIHNDVKYTCINIIQDCNTLSQKWRAHHSHSHIAIVLNTQDHCKMIYPINKTSLDHWQMLSVHF